MTTSLSDGLRALRWRAAVGLITVGLVFAWIWMAGGTGHLIQVDYSWAREWLDSAEVEIDGQVVGVLQPYGRGNYVTGFEVEPGEHVVRVLKEGCRSPADTVRLGGSYGRRATFIADYEDDYTCRVILR